jgi:hypothetical protein
MTTLVFGTIAIVIAVASLIIYRLSKKSKKTKRKKKIIKPSTPTVNTARKKCGSPRRSK